MIRLHLAAALAVSLGCALASAQKVPDAPPVSGGTVSGRVVLGDTGGPARFAKVMLKSTSPGGGDDLFSQMMKDADAEKKDAPGKPKKTPEQEAEDKKQRAAATKMFSALGEMLEATTVGADGVYVFGTVQPGTYYVHATAKGYIDPIAQFSEEDLASTDPAVKKRIAAVATMLTVTGAEGGHADLRLMRGAAISGRVLYDDGTPAVGWTVKVVHDSPGYDGGAFAEIGLDASDMDLAHLQEASITDDTGYYRVSGLGTGDYVVQAKLAVGAIGRAPVGGAADPDSAGMGMLSKLMGLKLTVYSGNVVRRSDARPVSVREGENRADYDLTMPLRTMHALGGVVRAKSDGHAVNAGLVHLTALTADGKEEPGMTLVTRVHGDGTFRFDYVQGPGNYKLKVMRAADEAPSTGKKKGLAGIADAKTTRSYGPATSDVKLGEGDLTDLKVDVPDAPVSK